MGEWWPTSPERYMKGKKSLPKLKKDLWKVFSEYVRKRDKGICFTCGSRAWGRNYHAGHFIPKSTGGLALYFHEDNVHGQCAKCNLFLQGNQYEYGLRLGVRRVNKLKKLVGKTTQWSEADYLKKIKLYKNKIKKLDEQTTI